MKKVLVLLVVLAITGISAMAFAAEVTVGGSLEVRSRDFNNLQVLPEDMNLNTAVTTPLPGSTLAATQDAYNKANDQRDTQNRIRIDINAKTDNVKAKLELESDFQAWGQFVEKYSTSGSSLGFREAWMNFNIPGIPVNVNVGHQLLKLGHGYFFQSMHFGSDAWVLANVTGNNTAAFVNVKALEGSTYANDDMDAYVLLDVVKLSDAMTVGVDITRVNDRRAALTNPAGAGTALTRALGLAANPFSDIVLNNFSANLTAALGALNLKAQVDYQTGEAASQVPGFNGMNIRANQIIVKGDVAAGPAKVNFLAARGSGLGNPNDNLTDIKQYVTILDIDPHVAFLYEYKVPTAAVNAVSQTPTDDQLHTGFANTTALNLGGAMDVSKSVNIGAQLWMFKATTPVAIHGATDLFGVKASRDVGNEIDLNVVWKLYDNLTWNWWVGYFMPGEAYDTPDPIATALTGLPSNKSADPATGIQGILKFSF